jgi:hypothetical protein
MLLARLYPSGLATASYIRQKFASELFPPLGSHGLTDDQRFQLKQVEHFGIEAAIQAQQVICDNPDPSSPLGLSNLSKTVTAENDSSLDYSFQLETLNTRRGSKGITSKGRRMVKDACAILERDYARSQLSFVTLTLPTTNAIALQGEEWSMAVRSIKRKILRLLHDAGLPDELVMVSEVQEGRGMRLGVFALHLHVVFVGRFPGQHWAITTSQIESKWRESCEAIVGKDESTYWGASTQMVRVKKSLVGYMGKYLSKGCKMLAKVKEADPYFECPRAWYNVTNTLRKKVWKSIQVVSGEAAEDFMEQLQYYSDVLLKFQKYVTITGVDGDEIVVGWYGYVSDYETVSAMMYNCNSGIVYDVVDSNPNIVYVAA